MKVSFSIVVILFLMTAIIHPAVADTYTIDVSHSSIGFAVKHLMVAKTKGHFNDYKGSLELDFQKLENFNADVVIQVASIDTNIEARDNHLRSSDFFDAEKFPTITFKGKQLKKEGEGYIIVGDLTIKDVTKEIAIPVSIAGPVVSPFGGTVIGLEGQTTINRQDYNISWNKVLDSGGLVVDDVVEIMVSIEAKRE